MGTLFLALAITAAIIYGLYQLPYFKKQVAHWGEGNDSYWASDRNEYWDSEDRTWSIVLPIVGFFLIWLMVFCFARAGLVDRYERWESGYDIMSYTYDGENKDQFTVGRDGSYYYVLVKDEDEEGWKEAYYGISSTEIKTSSARGPHLEIKRGWKKVRKSDRPSMFFGKEDVIKEAGCGSEERLYVPSTFTFKDIE